MEFKGDYTFHGTPSAVFDTLTSPAALQRSIHGCEEFREVAPGQFRITLAVSIVVSTIRVSADVSLGEFDRPASYRLQASGSGSAGSLAIDGRFRLAPAPEGTLVNYTLAVETTGALSMLGGPIIEPTVKLIMGQTFGALDKELEQAPEGAAAP
ncbi:MAG: CoxG family protein [Dehalococcoidia bacterium]